MPSRPEEMFSTMMTYYLEVFSKKDCDLELLDSITEAFQMVS